MCAIGGILDFNNSVHDFESVMNSRAKQLDAMSAVMTDRGPDGGGVFNDRDFGVIHRLLRMQFKITAPGPYVSADERWVLSFNGEIYNFKELQAELTPRLKRVWVHHSDAEVLLEGWAIEGERFLTKVNGMFAFALWDRQSRELILVRDRVGEKPLYFTHQQNRFSFASEIKALLKTSNQKTLLNTEALGEYLKYRYVSGGNTLLSGIEKLRPAEIMRVSVQGKVTRSTYWSPLTPKQADRPTVQDFTEILASSHSLREISAWPAGVFLSGGIDSATIASFLPKGTTAFTFSSSMTVDETSEAAVIAQRFGLQHQVVRAECTFSESVDRALLALEEPLGDSIIVPTWHLAKAAAQTHRMIFSGEGADEIFGGYLHHWLFGNLLRFKGRFGNLGLYSLRIGLQIAPQKLLGALNPFPGDIAAEGRLRLLRTLDLLIHGVVAKDQFSSLFDNVIGFKVKSAQTPLSPHRAVETLRDYMLSDAQSFLPDYTLLRLDKILMSFGLEGRLPYLDHRLVEMAFQLPPTALIGLKQRKLILRKAAEARLGKEIAWRKKIPFVLNLSHATNEIHDTLKSAPGRLADRGIMNQQAAKKMSEDSESGSFLESKRLFALHALDRWAELFSVEGLH